MSSARRLYLPVSPREEQMTLTADELTLHMIATGLIALTQRTAAQEALFPYPELLQRGLNRLTVAALRQQVSPPASILELLDWCRRPLESWPLSLPAGLISPADQLLIDNEPSSSCDDWACTQPDIEAELTEQQLIRRVFSLCRDADDPVSYVAFRELLIKAPVLTALDLQKQLIQPDLIRVAEVLRESYQAAPAGWSIRGIFTCCVHCGNLLHPLTNGTFLCETEACRYERGPLHGQTIAVHEHPMWLIRGLRRFIAAPGRAELRLADKLRASGVAVELWPAFDRYDLRITLADGKIWAVDVIVVGNQFGRLADYWYHCPGLLRYGD